MYSDSAAKSIQDQEDLQKAKARALMRFHGLTVITIKDFVDFVDPVTLKPRQTLAELEDEELQCIREERRKQEKKQQKAAQQCGTAHALSEAPVPLHAASPAPVPASALPGEQWSEEEKQAMRDARARGETDAKIADRYGISRQRVAQLIGSKTQVRLQASERRAQTAA